MIGMTQTHRALAALALLGASVVHLAVAATGPASAVALLLGALGLAEATGAAAVARGAFADRPGALAALLVLPVLVPTGALTIANALERPDLTAALLQPTLLGAALLAFAGALVAAVASRRLRATDARTEQTGAPTRPARQAALLVTAALVTGLVSAPPVTRGTSATRRDPTRGRAQLAFSTARPMSGSTSAMNRRTSSSTITSLGRSPRVR